MLDLVLCGGLLALSDALQADRLQRWTFDRWTFDRWTFDNLAHLGINVLLLFECLALTWWITVC